MHFLFFIWLCFFSFILKQVLIYFSCLGECCDVIGVKLQKSNFFFPATFHTPRDRFALTPLRFVLCFVSFPTCDPCPSGFCFLGKNNNLTFYWHKGEEIRTDFSCLDEFNLERGVYKPLSPHCVNHPSSTDSRAHQQIQFILLLPTQDASLHCHAPFRSISKSDWAE